MMSKSCTKCREKLSATSEYFHKCKKGKDGLKAKCKKCLKEINKKYYKENKSKYKKHDKEYYQNNKEKREKYLKENREEITKKKKAYYQKTKERQIKNAQEWRKRKLIEDPDYFKRQYLKTKREYSISTKFGISLKEYNEMLEKQSFVCKICGQINKSGNFLSIDHDHKTGEIRGLLCQYCNSGLGWMRDNPFILIKAIKYLRGDL